MESHVESLAGLAQQVILHNITDLESIKPRGGGDNVTDIYSKLQSEEPTLEGVGKALGCIYNRELFTKININKVRGELDIDKIFSSSNTLIYGDIQSGKTKYILFSCWWSLYVLKMSCIVVLRNIKSDSYQLIQRIEEFNKEYLTSPISLFPLDSETLEPEKPSVLITLSNSTRLTKLERVNYEYTLIVDEVDLLYKSESGENFKVERPYSILTENSTYMIGVTATPLSVIRLEPKFNNLILVPKKESYVSIMDINHSVIRGLCENDIRGVWGLFSNKPKGLLLHAVNTTIAMHSLTAKKLSELHPEMAIVVHNGTGISIISKTDIIIDSTSKKKKQKVRSSSVGTMSENWKVYCTTTKYNTQETFSTHYEHIFDSSYTIPEILQLIKDDKRRYTHTVIISKLLSSRGMSYVSSDYKLHVSDQIYCANFIGSSLIQGVRICGNWENNKNVTLHTPVSIMTELIKHYLFVKRCMEHINKCKLNNDPRLFKSMIEDLELIEKPRGSLVRKDLGGFKWNTNPNGTYSLIIS